MVCVRMCVFVPGFKEEEEEGRRSMAEKTKVVRKSNRSIEKVCGWGGGGVQIDATLFLPTECYSSFHTASLTKCGIWDL